MRTEIHKLGKNHKDGKNHKLDKNHKGGKNHKLAQKNHKGGKNHKPGKNHIMRLLRFFERCVGAILADLCAVRYAHMTRIERGPIPMRLAFGGFSRF